MSGQQPGAPAHPDARLPAAWNEYPSMINVEVLRGRCPCRCRHCPVGQTASEAQAQRFGTGSMAVGLFRKIVDETSAHAHATVRIHAVGEPLLWRHIVPALRYARERGVRTWVFTSAAIRDEPLLRDVCAADIIEVSINSTTSADYLATKGVDAFSLVQANVGFIRRAFQKRGSKTRLLVSRVQSDEPKADADFVRFWKTTGLVDDAFVRTYHSYNGLLSGRSTPAAGACLVHWARFNVALDGTALVCFNELFRRAVRQEAVLGNIVDSSIRGVWQGPGLQALRQAALSGYPDDSVASARSCRRCAYRQPLGGGQTTSDSQIEVIGRELPTIQGSPGKAPGRGQDHDPRRTRFASSDPTHLRAHDIGTAPSRYLGFARGFRREEY